MFKQYNYQKINMLVNLMLKKKNCTGFNYFIISLNNSFSFSKVFFKMFPLFSESSHLITIASDTYPEK